ncbi:MAG: hypothetical protein FWE26_05300 [Coriobacteriia bacterium]|nr:hypothetical protein [Coriobacteriia bacterium]
MRIAERAIKALFRNLGKAVILLLVIFVLGCAISGTISIRQAVQNTDTNLRLDLPGIASVQSDMAAIEEQYRITGEWPVLEPVSMDTLLKIGTLPHVRNYSISTHAGLLGRDLEQVTVDEGIFETDITGEGWTSVNLKGVHGEGLLDADEGVVEIISGRLFTEVEADTLSYFALISREFARLNDLGVGSTLTLENIVWDEDAFNRSSFSDDDIFAQQSYDFEIIGIFSPVAEIDTGDEWTDKALMEDIENRIYTSNAVVFAAAGFQIEQAARMRPSEGQMIEAPEDALFLESIYTLYDSDDLVDFKASATEIIPEFWMVSTAGDAFDDIAASMKTLNNLATTVLWIAIGASVLIVSLLTTLFLRERKKKLVST